MLPSCAAMCCVHPVLCADVYGRRGLACLIGKRQAVKLYCIGFAVYMDGGTEPTARPSSACCLWNSTLAGRVCLQHVLVQCCRSADIIQQVLFPLGSTAWLGATIASHTLVFLYMHQGRITPCAGPADATPRCIQHCAEGGLRGLLFLALHWQACFSWSLLSGACSDCCTSYTLVSLCFLCHQWCRMEASALVVSHPCG
jgi:hypothetical protein